MLHEKARPLIDTALKKCGGGWTERRLFPGCPRVQISNVILARLGREPDVLETVAVVGYCDGPNEDENPDSEVEQVMLRFTRPGRPPLDTYTIFHDGQYWIATHPFLR
jgi:hypothetical protein